MTHYCKEVKAKCMELILSGRMLSSSTTEYGLGAGTLQYWMTDYYQKVKPRKKEKYSEKVILLNENKELKRKLDF